MDGTWTLSGCPTSLCQGARLEARPGQRNPSHTQRNPSQLQQKPSPGGAKSKSGATKSKCLFLPRTQVYQMVILDSGRLATSRPPLVLRRPGGPRRTLQCSPLEHPSRRAFGAPRGMRRWFAPRNRAPLRSLEHESIGSKGARRESPFANLFSEKSNHGFGNLARQCRFLRLSSWWSSTSGPIRRRLGAVVARGPIRRDSSKAALDPERRSGASPNRKRRAARK
jgi:hypothetical protein